MLKYTCKRILQALIVLWGVYTLTFLVVNLVPGDPVAMMMNRRADAETIERIRHQLGMDLPLYQQYLTYLGNVLHGDFGMSYIKSVPVLDLITKGFSTTVRLGLSAYAIAVCIGLPAGIFTALKRGKVADRVGIILIMLMVSVPSFWLAVLLQILFGLKLSWFPISGMGSANWWVLPAVTLGVGYSAIMARLTRTNVLEALSQDYVKTAYAKGLKGCAVILGHVLKNAAIPTVTLFGLQLPSVLGGAMIIEQIFSLPGIGTVAIDAINNRDIPVIQGTVLYSASIFVLINLLVDLLYGLLDPRIRVGGKEEA
ncbi:MAG: ABC transporter permease [Candidatus Limivivens sp.]|nr:ABC transporter permease [Candidatus Limivivens sp.]